MLLRGDIAKNLDIAYRGYLKPLHVVSDKLVQLDDTSLGVYSFDDISASFFEKSKKPTSADAVCANSKSLVFIEFKTGFNDSDDYPISKDCRHCKEHQKNITGSLLLKIAETHKVFERKFLDTIIEKSAREKDYRIEFWIVLNDDEPQFSPIENIESILEDMSEVSSNSTNYISRINESVKRFRQSNYWFDEVEVMSARTFRKKSNLRDFLTTIPDHQS